MTRARDLAEAHRLLWAMVAAVLNDDSHGLRALAADLNHRAARDIATAGAVFVAELLTNPDMPAYPRPAEEVLAELQEMLAMVADRGDEAT